MEHRESPVFFFSKKEQKSIKINFFLKKNFQKKKSS